MCAPMREIADENGVLITVPCHGDKYTLRRVAHMPQGRDLINT